MDSTCPQETPAHSRESSGQSAYKKRVGFNALADSRPGDSLFSFTLQCSTSSFKRNRNSRTYLVAASNDDFGKQALEWALKNMIESQDEIVALRVFEDDTNLTLDEQKFAKEEAQALMDLIMERNSQGDYKELSIVVEFVAGSVTESIQSMISMYQPDSLIVGTRGKTGKWNAFNQALKVQGMGSVSKYCVSHSPVPVIVVRPQNKVLASLEKRSGGCPYAQLLDQNRTD